MKDTLYSLSAFDGYPLEVLLSEPDTETDRAVLFVNGSGPHTCRDKRQFEDRTFFYYDLYAEAFTRRSFAFCRCSARGAHASETPPFFCDLNWEEYRTYLPHTSIEDVLTMARDLLSRGYTRLYLLGWSEGSIIAPRVVLRNEVPIAGLLLAGYCNDNLHDILKWQMNGGSSLLYYRRMFDYDRKGYISEQDFDEDRYQVRAQVFGDTAFSVLDRDRDGKLTAADFDQSAYFSWVEDAVERGDDEWILQNLPPVPLTSGWLREHFALQPNREILPQIDLPIHIFAGEYDAATPMSQTDAVEEQFRALGKTNLTVHRFPEHDHDLLYISYIVSGTIPDGIQAIFDAAETL